MNDNQEKNYFSVHADDHLKYNLSSSVVFGLVGLIGFVLDKFSLEFVSFGFLGLFSGYGDERDGLTAEQVQGVKT